MCVDSLCGASLNDPLNVALRRFTFLRFESLRVASLRLALRNAAVVRLALPCVALHFAVLLFASRWVSLFPVRIVASR